MKRNHEVVLHLTREEFAHIMGSVSQDDVEYVSCPEPLKNYLNGVSLKHNICDKWDKILRIGW